MEFVSKSFLYNEMIKSLIFQLFILRVALRTNGLSKLGGA